jgi:hypothetical protein
MGGNAMTTTDHVRLTIDLSRVARNLRLADGQAVGEETARSFLRYAGFDPDPHGKWVGPRAQLGRFNPGEVIGVEPLVAARR